MKKFVPYVLSSTLFFSSFSQAYDCIGKVNNVVVGPNGILTLSVGNINWVYLCSVSASYNGIAPDTCKAMLSVAMAAKLSDRNIQLWFSDTSNDCTNAAHPAWADLKNWYYGPALL